MAKPRIYTTTALVLKYRNYGESDRFVTLLSRDLGQIQGFAKGIRRSTAKLTGHLELFYKVIIMQNTATADKAAAEITMLFLFVSFSSSLSFFIKLFKSTFDELLVRFSSEEINSLSSSLIETIKAPL